MDHFHYDGGELWAEGVPVARVVEDVGTPVYLYSRRTIEEHFGKVEDAFRGVRTLVCYSVKANANLSILRLLAGKNSGFDVVSVGELERALAVGAPPERIVYAGVGKREDEIRRALSVGILMMNVESEEEVRLISRVAGERGVRARISIRVNPDVDPRTHRYISTGKEENKFGIDLVRAGRLASSLEGSPSIELAGLHIHIGSQITDTEPYTQAVSKVVGFARECRAAGHRIEWINTGGGFGVYYKGDEALPVDAFARQIVPPVSEGGFHLILEPGRFIVGNAGILLTRVLYVKEGGRKTFAICDAGMSDLIRPSLYGAYHRIWPIRADRPAPPAGVEEAGLVKTDVVGPICESGDFFALDRPLPPLASGDFLAVFTAGAYGSTMSSHYNTRPKAAEVLVDGEGFRVVRRRETVRELLALELECLGEGR